MPENSRRIPKYLVLVCFLMIISAIDFVRMALFITFLPSYLPQLGYTLGTLGLVMTANLLTDNLSKGVTGWLVDHYGPWPVLFSGSALLFIGVILINYFHAHLALMILAAVLIGIGVAPTWPAVVSGAIRTVGETKKATMISVISVIWLTGGGLGPVLMGFLIDSGKRANLMKVNLVIDDVYRTCFDILMFVAMLGVVVSIIGWVCWIWMHPAVSNQVSNDPPRKKLKSILSTLAEVKGLIPGMMIQTLSLGMLLPVLLPFITKRLGLSESQYSMVLIVGGSFVVALMVPVGHFADKWGARRFLVTGFLLASFSLIAAATWGTKENIWLIAAVIGFSYAMIQPAWNALLAGSIPPAQRGVLMGLFMSVEGLGFAIGPILGGFLGNLKKPISVFPFYLSGLLLLVMAVVYVFLPFQTIRNEAQ